VWRGIASSAASARACVLAARQPARRPRALRVEPPLSRPGAGRDPASRPERGADAKFAERSALAATHAKHDVTRRGFLADRRGTDRAQAFAPPVSRKPGHCAFGSATVEASNGLAVASNRLASMTKFASMLTTDSRNGASRRVPATGASATSISRAGSRRPRSLHAAAALVGKDLGVASYGH